MTGISDVAMRPAIAGGGEGSTHSEEAQLLRSKGGKGRNAGGGGWQVWLWGLMDGAGRRREEEEGGGKNGGGDEHVGGMAGGHGVKEGEDIVCERSRGRAVDNEVARWLAYICRIAIRSSLLRHKFVLILSTLSLPK